MNKAVRTPVVAGMFYPADAQELHTLIQNFLQQIEVTEAAPKAMIVPHAGYVYSGAIAASAYARLIPVRHQINKVVLLGPSHRVPLFGLAATEMDYFATPLGDVPVDRQAIDTALALPQVTVIEQAHAYEHSLEVHLPFLQAVLAQFSIIPLVVGEATPEQVGEVLEKLWGGTETVIIISSDLSHYHDYNTARRLDQLTSQAIEALRFEDIRHECVCGHTPVSGLLYVARQRGMQAKTVDLRNSGDTAGSKHQVVGYGTYVFH